MKCISMRDTASMAGSELIRQKGFRKRSQKKKKKTKPTVMTMYQRTKSPALGGVAKSTPFDSHN